MCLPLLIKPPRRNQCRSAFTLIEILIVVVILGILAALAVPKFSNASQSARENTLKDEMRYLRTQITVYTSQHGDVAPGYPSGDTTQNPDAPTFIAQMTQYTDQYGNVSATPGGVYTFGVYLSQMPTNPVNSFVTITIVPSGAAFTPDGTTGWLYQPSTGAVMPNLLGSDSEGTAYNKY
jgi:general secretion pathway protein G